MNCLPDTCVSRTKLIMMFKYFTALFACLVGLKKQKNGKKRLEKKK